MYEDCKYQSGLGNKSGSVVVLYARPGDRGFFPHGKYLSELCKALNLDEKEFYVTPLVKDDPGSQKPIHVYVDGLINELALVKPKVVWVLGQEALVLMQNNDVPQHYRYTYGMYFPFLLYNFYGLLVPSEGEVANMPESVQRIFYKRLQYAASELLESGEILTPPDERRGDLEMFRKLESNTPLHEDKKLQDEHSYAVIWSDKVRDYIVLVNSQDAKKHAKRLGFGLILDKDEVKDLDKGSADRLAGYMKVLGAREVIKK